jgi:hypothetical protein
VTDPAPSDPGRRLAHARRRPVQTGQRYVSVKKIRAG